MYVSVRVRMYVYNSSLHYYIRINSRVGKDRDYEGHVRLVGKRITFTDRVHTYWTVATLSTSLYLSLLLSDRHHVTVH